MADDHIVSINDYAFHVRLFRVPAQCIGLSATSTRETIYTVPVTAPHLPSRKQTTTSRVVQRMGAGQSQFSTFRICLDLVAVEILTEPSRDPVLLHGRILGDRQGERLIIDLDVAPLR
jgi:hypothetical protein